jgi:hypothetical protein
MDYMQHAENVRRVQNVCSLQKWFYLYNWFKFQFTYYRTHVT